MKECTNCAGEGLVGQGENPRLKLGRIVTCEKCSGSGKVTEEKPVEAAEVTEEKPVEAAEVVPPAGTPVDSVDNSAAPTDTQPAASSDVAAADASAPTA